MRRRAPPIAAICASAHIIITSPADFQRKILWASARDPEARAAMLAWREARSLAMNAPAKFALLEELFARHAGERVLVSANITRWSMRSATLRHPADYA